MRRDRASAEGGAAAVEFALVVVLLLTLVFGIIEYSLYFWQTQSGEAAARETARYAAVGATSCTDMKDAAAGTVSPLATNVTTTVTGLTGGSVGGTATATVQFTPFRIGLPFVPVPSGDVQHSAQFRIENIVAGINDSDCV